MKKTIYLNAGHSHLDPGAVVPNDRFEYESQLNIAIRDALIPELKRHSFIVEAVPDNLNLPQSYGWVNERTFGIEDGLALSIHNNCCGGEGAESYYYKHALLSKAIAEKLIIGYCLKTKLKHRGAKSDLTTRYRELSWIRETIPWATLIECGFMDNAKDMEFIINNIDKVAKGICKGVCAIYGIPYKEESSTGRKETKEKITASAEEIIKLAKTL